MASFIDNKLIFSIEPKYRIGRHLLFWFCWWLYFALLHAANSFGAKEIMYFNNLPFTISESLLMMIPQIIMAYPMLYFILPRFFLRKKYFSGFLLFAVLWFIGGMTSLYMSLYINQPILETLLPEPYVRFPPRNHNTTIFMGLLVNWKGGMAGTIFSSSVKIMKDWYLKEHRNLQLQKENTESQLRLLTAQVHPHFLFNTLNNIYSQTQTESPRGSKMIMGLSDMLRYILYEGQKPLVLLKQELLMITEYINLEKIRYGNKLDVHVLMPDKTDDVYIAPLLLLPFVENCFKHGTSNILQNPWINLTIELKDTNLVMKLMNGKTSQNGRFQNKQGIGITNVSQRLNLLYKDKYELQIREDEEVFVVDLQVELTRIKGKKNDDVTAQPEQTPVYV